MDTDLKLYVADHGIDGTVIIHARNREDLSAIVAEQLRAAGNLSADGVTLIGAGFNGDSLEWFLGFFDEHELTDIVHLCAQTSYVEDLFTRPPNSPRRF